MIVTDKHAFYASFLAGAPADWIIAPGVELCARCEHHEWGIALQVEHTLLPAWQLKRALELRFSDQVKYSEYFLFVDLTRNLVIWHPTTGPRLNAEEVDTVRYRLLALVSMTALYWQDYQNDTDGHSARIRQLTSIHKR